MRIEGSASAEIAAPAHRLWSMVTDITRMGEWSPETYTSRWLGAPGPVVGARFQGCNQLTWVGTWCSTATITECDPPRSFAFVIGKDAERPNTEWSYTFEPTGDATTLVTERYRMIREPLAVRGYYRLIQRDRQLAQGTAETLRRLKEAAEHPTPGPLAGAGEAAAAAARTLPRPPALAYLAGRRVHHPLFARLYGRFSPASETKGTGAHRDSLLAGLAGEVIEIGCGNGLNFTHYPPTVTTVVAVEPEPYLRGLAQTAATAPSATTIRVIDGRAEAIPVPDASFDAAVVSLILCSVSDPAAVLAEIYRVLRPGGELRFYEHVQAASDPLRRLQRAAAPLWQTVAGGCRPDRDTPATIESTGFHIERIDRFDFRPGPMVPLGLVTPHVLGVAHKLPAQSTVDIAPHY